METYPRFVSVPDGDNRKRIELSPTEYLDVEIFTDGKIYISASDRLVIKPVAGNCIEATVTRYSDGN